ncbi:MAG: hypothetical protein RML34_07820 [Leptospiraceae bacterium]|nr:hypothetical protein [Leptospiraceae bacterium]
MKIRLNFDSNAIAAGAAYVGEALQRELGKTWQIIKVGTNGLSYADPQIEVEAEHLPAVIFGKLNAHNIAYLLEDFFQHGLFPREEFFRSGGCILGGRTFMKKRGGAITHILVSDTSLPLQDKNRAYVLSLLSRFFSPGQYAWALDFGFYNRGFAIEIFPQSEVYAGFSIEELPELFGLLSQGQGLAIHKRFSEPLQLRLVSKNCGRMSAESIEEALQLGGYDALQTSLKKLSPEAVISEVEKSGLRGRGGAGYPTALKWKLTRQEKNFPKYVICNADEGDPGAFMDRSLLESDPHRVLEGLILAGYAIGAEQGYFYIRAEYPLATQRIRRAVEEARQYGFLGKNILGSGFSFDVKVRLAALVVFSCAIYTKSFWPGQMRKGK